jgi:hypothetical protein
MKRKKRNPKIIEMSLFNIGRRSRSEIDSKLRKQIEETNKKNREEIEKRKYTKEHDKRVEELKRQKGAEAQSTKSSDFPNYNPADKLAQQVKRAISTSKQRSDSNVVNPPSYNPADKLAQQVKRAISISKQRSDSDVASPSKYDPYSSPKLQQIKGNKKVDTASYLSNEELLQRVYCMFGMSYNYICRF